MATIDATATSPVQPRDRDLNLDMLRGLAVLGILAVNAVAFAWPVQIYMSPQAAPFDMIGADRLGAWVTDVFFHDKFRSLFSMLFGVSIFLVGRERDDDEGGRLVRRRLFWLALFGLIHGLALWFGDILLHYAYTGLLMLLFRSWSGRRLLGVGGGLCLAWGLLGGGMAVAMAHLPPDIAAQMEEGQRVSPDAILATIQQVRSGWGPAMLENLKAWAVVQGFSLLLIPVTLSLMMLGLGLYKTGWLSGRSAAWTYVAAILAGAVTLTSLAVLQNLALGVEGSDPTRGMAEAAAQFGFVITIGYAAVLILATRLGFGLFRRVLAPVGRMALTNYLSQSLIMASLFYMPWGPRLYGEWGPGMLWVAIIGIWLIQLAWSPLWLSRCRMGPLEWLWRCLIHGRRLPLRN